MEKGLVYGPSVDSSFTWILKEYSKLSSGVGELVKSPSFKLGGESSVELQLYPGGGAQNDTSYVSVYFCLKGTKKKEIYLKYSITFVTSEGKELTKNTTNLHILEIPASRGWSRFVTRSTLSGLPNDILIISFEVSCSEPLINLEMADVSTVADLLSAWEKGLHSDVAFSVEGTELPAHKFVLAARSEVFAAMFKHDTLEKDANKIEITDFDVRTVKAMLRFLYGGKLDNMDVSLAVELLRAADKYCMGTLMLFCSNFLMSNIDKANACSILISADKHNALELKSKALGYICEELGAEDFEKQKSVLKEHPEVHSEVTERLFELKKGGFMPRAVEL